MSARPTYWADFNEPPSAGFAKMYLGQRFVMERAEGATRKDGTPCTILVWSTHCAECGEPIETTTGLKAASPTRRCRAHANRFRKVRP